MLYFSIAMLIFSGCSKTDKIQFCEGVSPEGEGIHCGKKFEDGDLTAVITSDEPFDAKTIDVTIYEAREKRTEKIGSIKVDVNPEKQVATVNIPLYAGGRYVVRAVKNDVLIGEGAVEIFEK